MGAARAVASLATLQRVTDTPNAQRSIMSVAQVFQTEAVTVVAVSAIAPMRMSDASSIHEDAVN